MQLFWKTWFGRVHFNIIWKTYAQKWHLHVTFFVTSTCRTQLSRPQPTSSSPCVSSTRCSKRTAVHSMTPVSWTLNWFLSAKLMESRTVFRVSPGIRSPPLIHSKQGNHSVSIHLKIGTYPMQIHGMWPPKKKGPCTVALTEAPNNQMEEQLHCSTLKSQNLAIMEKMQPKNWSKLDKKRNQVEFLFGKKGKELKKLTTKNKQNINKKWNSQSWLNHFPAWDPELQSSSAQRSESFQAPSAEHVLPISVHQTKNKADWLDWDIRYLIFVFLRLLWKSQCIWALDSKQEILVPKASGTSSSSLTRLRTSSCFQWSSCVTCLCATKKIKKIPRSKNVETDHHLAHFTPLGSLALICRSAQRWCPASEPNLPNNGFS